MQMENGREGQVKWSIAVSMALLIAVVAAIGQGTSAGDGQRQAALVLEQQGRVSDAEAAWQAVAKAHPTDAEAYAHLGLLQAQEAHYKEAVPFYRRALALNPRMPGLQLDLGLAYFKGGDLKSALATFGPLLRAAPRESPEALRLTTLIGLADYGLGAYASAIPHLKRATAADPQNLPFRLALAHSCLWTKQYQCVLDVYHEIVTLNADSAEADMLAGEALDEMKDRTGAVQQFRAAVKADPKMPDVHFGLGYLLWGSLQFDEAAKEFQAELDNNPDQAQALTYLGDCAMQLEQPDTATPLLEKAIRIAPKIEQAHLDLGILYDKAGRHDDALRELKTAERLNPEDQAVHWRLARFYKEIGRNEEAKIEFEKTRSLQKAADESVSDKLHQAQEQEKAAQQSQSSPKQ
jgi:tetratricopeptide (TPR) repeat protein